MSRTSSPAKARLFDLAAAIPQLVLYGAAIAGIGLRLGALLRAAQTSPLLQTSLETASQVLNGLYLSILMLLLVTRRVPVGSAAGVMPKVAALAGFTISGLLLLLPPARTSLPVRLISLGLSGGGAAASIYVVAFLGRSFSIFPQARGLVTGGPYRWVRHPLYFAESVAILGISLQFVQPWAMLVATAGILVQFPRMHYEEGVLSATYPAYDFIRPPDLAAFSRNLLIRPPRVPRTVSMWRARYAHEGLAGLSDRPRPGPPPKYDVQTGRRVLAVLDRPPPAGFARWTGPLIAAELGDVHEQQVWRILRVHKLDLGARKSWCESSDPQFEAKAADVVGLYMAPPQHAVVICVDEKPSIQALERAQGYLKLPNGRALNGQSHDYKRHGTSTLFAAFEVATGKVVAESWPGEFGQGDKWSLCLIAAMMPQEQERP